MTVTSGFKMERIRERVEWRFAIIRPGGLSAIMSMVHMQHTFSVYNWASMVSINTCVCMCVLLFHLVCSSTVNPCYIFVAISFLYKVMVEYYNIIEWYFIIL